MVGVGRPGPDRLVCRQIVAALDLAFAVCGGAVMGALGSCRHLGREVRPAGGVPEFLIMPLTMLSGVFYSIHFACPSSGSASHYNPVFYMIDGFRYGFFGVSDITQNSLQSSSPFRRRLPLTLSLQAGGEPEAWTNRCTPTRSKPPFSRRMTCEHSPDGDGHHFAAIAPSSSG